MGETGTGSAAHRQAEMMDDLLEPSGAPGPLGQHRHAEPFREYLARAARRAAPEPLHKEPQAHPAPRARQIRGLADVVALDTVRNRTTQRAERRDGLAAGGHDQHVFAAVDAVHRQPGWDQRCKTKPGRHGMLLS